MMPPRHVAAVLPFVLAAQINLGAQGPAAQPPAVPMPVPATIAVDAQETREQLREVLRQYPPSLPRVLALDPSLMQSQQYLSTYPALGAFLASHPEVARDPGYYLGYVVRSEDHDPQSRVFRVWERLVEGTQILAGMLIVTGAIVWLIRTLLDYRKWLRLARVQAEVHTKLLDRFGANEDLLSYIQTPAGRRFLESAPIPLAAESPRAIAAPLGRILWSVQAGVVLFVTGVGLQIVAARQTLEEIGQPLSMMGIIVVALGIGFVISAVASLLLSRRLGLLGGGTEPGATELPS